MSEPGPLLVDARPLAHPTAAGRGIGNYTAGLLSGLARIGVPTTALVTDPSDGTSAQLPGGPAVLPWRRAEVRSFARDGGRWYVATGMFLHPISSDPIPRAITDAGLGVASVMYDVIPLRHPELYLTTPPPWRLAQLRSSLARTVDVHLAISAFSATTAIGALGLDRRRVAVIGAGVGDEFAPLPIEPAHRNTVVAVTGPDPRKNTEGLLRGWSLVDPGVRVGRTLVIVSAGPRELPDAWRALAEELGCASSVEFAGAVEDEALVALLQRAELAVQPSLEEGFGLPVLEAARCGVPGLCSNVSALPEVLDEPEATFDPEDPDDMARAIERGLTDGAIRERLRAAADRAVVRWTWPRVARDLVDALSRPALGTPGPPRLRIGLVGGAVAVGVAQTVARTSRTVDAVALIDPRCEGLAGGHDVEAWPLHALGRYVKVHDLDAMVIVPDVGAPPTASQLAEAAYGQLDGRELPLRLFDPQDQTTALTTIFGWLDREGISVETRREG
jgi:glycosyltransferase involved in cell wall biosynthesis